MMMMKRTLLLESVAAADSGGTELLLAVPTVCGLAVSGGAVLSCSLMGPAAVLPLVAWSKNACMLLNVRDLCGSMRYRTGTDGCRLRGAPGPSGSTTSRTCTR